MKALRSACYALLTVCTLGVSQAQVPTVIMESQYYDYCNANFYDDGYTGNYAPNSSFYLTLCPGNGFEDPSSVTQVAFNTFNLGPGDQLDIYQGPDASYPLIISGNSSTSLAGLVYQGDPSTWGCLTLVFTSDGFGEGPGWSALITCSTPCTPPTAVVAPAGYMEVCQDEPVVLDGSASYSGNFPITGYIWDLPPGGTSNGATANLSFSEGGQYEVELFVVDALGCVSQSPDFVSIRVPTTPDFIGTMVSDDEICLGDAVDFTGVVNGHSWTNVPQPLVAGQTPLPDGGGISYNTTVQVSGFEDGATVSSASDIIQVCMVIEHSFIGDLTATLTAPGGQQVMLFNGFGAGNGGTYLGSPLDAGNDDGVPGVGAQYCFSMAAVFGTLVSENANGNHITTGNPPSNSMTPGSYTPEGDFSSWIGSELNGGWTITITDNIGSDDGFIFEWWLDINPALYPDVVEFTPTYPVQNWTGPDIVSTGTGTASATPTVEGDLVYTFSVEDDFGCPWDTSITITVNPPVMDFLAASVVFCADADPEDLLGHLDPEEDGATVSSNGTWTGPGGGPFTGIFNPASSASGLYTYTLGAGTECLSTGTVQVSTQQPAQAGNDMNLAYCSSVPPIDLFGQVTGSPEADGVWWMPDTTVFDGVLDPATMAPGVYWYVLPAEEPCSADTAFVTVAIPQAAQPGTDSTIALCRDTVPFSMRATLGGTPDLNGTWTAPGGGPVDDLLDAATAVSGTYVYTVPATLPCQAQVAELVIAFDAVPWAGIDDSTVVCANDLQFGLLPLLTGSPDAGGVWMDPLGGVHSGLLDPSLELSGDYTYVMTGLGECAHLTDSSQVHVTVNPLPNISFTVEPDSGCHPLNVVLTNTTDPAEIAGDCIWNLGDGTEPIVECGFVEHLYEEPGWYHVRLRITNPLGCTDELLVQGAVLVQPAPQATFTWTPNPGTPENSTVVFTALDPYATVFHWNFEGGDTTSGRQVSRYYPHVLTDEYEVCLDVLDRYGCADTACAIVPVVVPSVFVPNAFTPNGDGHNDFFMPFVDQFAAEGFIWRIVDRWGHVVFETTDPAEPWTGEHKNGGGILPEGIYVWELTARPIHSPDVQDRNGIVTLLK